MSRLGAGSFSRKVEILRRTEVLDGTNQPVAGDLEPYLVLRARPVGDSGMAAIRAAESGIALSAGRYSWRVRYRPTGIDTGMVLRHAGILFDIKAVRHDFEHHDWTDIVCETGANIG